MRPNQKQFSIFVILLLAALLRIWGLDFGLPNDRCRPDEYMISVVALGMGNGDLNPHFFNYPTLFIYLCFICYGLYFVLGYAAGFFHQPADLGLSFFINPTPFYLISRSLSVAAGVTSVFLLYKIGRRYFSETIAIVASLLLALAPLHVRDSHFGVTDVLMTMLVLSAVYYMLEFHDAGEPKHAVQSAVRAGLAAAAKYNGGLALLAPVIVLFLRHRREGNWGSTLSLAGSMLIAFALALLLASPFILLDFHRFWIDFQFELQHLQSGHLGMVLNRGWIHHLRFSLFYGLGWPFLLAAIPGLYLLGKRYGQKALLVLVFPAAYYLLVGKGYTVFSRYSLPLIPFLALAAAAGIEAVKTRSHRLAALGTLVIAGHCLWTVIPSDRLLAQKDSRLLAADWLMQNAANNASVLYHTSVWATPQLPLAHDSLIKLGSHTPTADKPGLTRLYQQRLAYFQQKKIPVYHQYLLDNPDASAVASTLRPDYIVVEHSEIAGASNLSMTMQTLLDAEYQLQHTVLAAEQNNGQRHYDPQDAFYLPLAGFNGVQRPGPNLQIYQRKP